VSHGLLPLHAQPAGTGERVLEYLARYLFRVAICNSRLEHVDDEHVIFRYRDTPAPSSSSPCSAASPTGLHDPVATTIPAPSSPHVLGT
jgi:hypothetical protein